jgi:hypothetical protein
VLPLGLKIKTKSYPLQSGAQLVDATSLIAIAPVLERADQKLMSTMAFSWSCDNSLDVRDPMISLSRFGGPALVLAPDALSADVLYTCKLMANDTTGRVGFAEISLTSAAKPASGTCWSHPSNGTAPQFDVFTFKCDGWTSISGSLSYRFALLKWDRQSFDWKPSQRYGRFEEATELAIKTIPAGRPERMFVQKFRAYIRDNTEVPVYSQFDFEATITPIPRETIIATEGGVDAYTEKLMDSEMKTALEEGDLDKTAQVIATMTEMLKTNESATSPTVNPKRNNQPSKPSKHSDQPPKPNKRNNLPVSP